MLPEHYPPQGGFFIIKLSNLRETLKTFTEDFVAHQ
jgi:hypothetical protein